MLDFLKKFEIDMRFEEQISVKLLSDITNVFFLTLFIFQIIIVAPIVEEIVLKSKSNRKVVFIIISNAFSLLYFNENKSDISEPIVMQSLFNAVGAIGVLVKV